MSRVTLALAGLLLAGMASAAAPAPGRYRCCQPPGYTVMAWFDFGAAGISVRGDAPQAVRINAASMPQRGASICRAAI